MEIGFGNEKKCIFAASFDTHYMAVVAQLVRVPDCGSVGRRFESDLPPESKAATRNCRCFAFNHHSYI